MTKPLAEVIALSIMEQNAEVVTHVPGFGGTQIFSALNDISDKKYLHSYHEEPALAIAHTAAVAGTRSACLIKSHGLMKAANCFTDIIYADNTAGCVIFISEDKTGSHSDNLLKIEPFLTGFNVPVLHMDKENVQKTILTAYKQSEDLELPVVVITDADTIMDEVPYHESFPKTICKKKYQRSLLKHVVHPYFSDYQYKNMLYKTSQRGAPTYDGKLMLVPNNVPEPYAPTVNLYKQFFDAFMEFRGDMVCGDTSISSSYVLQPYNSIDIVTYMGASIPNAVGATLAGFEDVWALTGDFGFISAASLGLVEAIQRELPIKVVIFNNKVAGATGGQTINQTLLETLLKPFEENLVKVDDPQDPKELVLKLNQVKLADKLQILLLDY